VPPGKKRPKRWQARGWKGENHAKDAKACTMRKAWKRGKETSDKRVKKPESLRSGNLTVSPNKKSLTNAKIKGYRKGAGKQLAVPIQEKRFTKKSSCESWMGLLRHPPEKKRSPPRDPGDDMTPHQKCQRNPKTPKKGKQETPNRHHHQLC